MTPEERALLDRSIAAHEAADVTALAEMLREDVRIAMPPLPFWFNDKATFLPGLGPGLREPGEWRLVAVRANRMPAVATYLRPWDGTEFEPFKIDVMRMEGGLVAEITTFDARLFPAFGLRRPAGSLTRSGRHVREYARTQRSGSTIGAIIAAPHEATMKTPRSGWWQRRRGATPLPGRDTRGRLRRPRRRTSLGSRCAAVAG